ncbi:MAG: phosphate signaling complex protein PhoU [Kiritimatiellaceae bacterium]|nr:phosphate signaling complex protein PhoU [Kiritimatiellaceae bacterium]
MERHFDEQLTTLKNTLMKMSSLCELMITDAIRVLCTRETSMIPSISENEDLVNHLQMEIDSLCLKLIALYQPTANDLRFILGAVKTNNDIERMADMAITICRKAERLIEEPTLGAVITSNLSEMTALASVMVKESLSAFVNSQLDKAHVVLLRDDQLDEMNRRLTRDLMDLMKQDSGTIQRAVDTLIVVRNLERIGDHATNIAENAIFVVNGMDIRHHHDLH